jgi:N6-L-threonylcarbamoyladenine synthase
MLVLGIETSCDETAVALVKDGRTCLSSVIASQVATHKKFGGVVPEIAAREHLLALPAIFREALREASITEHAVDAIAVTQGPGLIGALLVGVSFAKGLALRLGRPLIPVDHVHAHIHGTFLDNTEWNLAGSATFPCLALVVSGGHTNLYRMDGYTNFQLLGRSLDDACGESFDKIAKLLGFPYPGGPAIERAAVSGRPAHSLKVLDDGSLQFSYSGIKTHFAQMIRKGTVAHEDICSSFQETAFEQLIRKTARAAQAHRDIRSIVVAGGVSANQVFRSKLCGAVNVPVYFPHLRYCSDNAAMIAALGFHLAVAGFPADMTWDAYSRYSFNV